MTPVLIGQIMGVSFASGLNIYATVAALGLLSRMGIIQELPPALHGLQSSIIIGTALVLYMVEAIIDRVHHVDSLWDTVHTFVRPPAAALLAVGMLWAQPLHLQLAAAGMAFLVALAAHGTKAGFRIAVNAASRKRSITPISTGEDLVAVLFVVGAFEYPATALIAGVAALALIGLFGSRLWRAFTLGFRCVTAWIRALFITPGWRDADALPRRLRALLDDPPLGTAPHRTTRAAVNGIPGIGAYRNGWLVVTPDGPAFLCNGLLRARRVDLPDPVEMNIDPGPWVNEIHVRHQDSSFTLYLLQDGPPAELVLAELETVPL